MESDGTLIKKILLWTYLRNSSAKEEAAIFPCWFTEQNCGSADGSLNFCTVTVVGKGKKEQQRTKPNQTPSPQTQE